MLEESGPVWQERTDRAALIFFRSVAKRFIAEELNMGVGPDGKADDSKSSKTGFDSLHPREEKITIITATNFNWNGQVE